jgi:hypothetical protein
LRLFIQTVLRFFAGAYFVLTSLYCLLAYLPYTYTAFIKAPPYLWMPWFAHHQAAIYWLAVAAGIVAAEGGELRDHLQRRDRRLVLAITAFVAVGIYLTVRPFLPGLQSNRAAYWWSLASLLPLIGFSLWRSSGSTASDSSSSAQSLFSYSSGLIVAIAVSVIYMIGARLQMYHENQSLKLDKQVADIALWSLISHIAVAMAVLSGLNLIYLVATRTRWPRSVRRWLIGLSIVAGLWIVTERFLDTAMSFDGWSAYGFALAFAASVTLWGFALVEPFAAAGVFGAEKLSALRMILICAVIAVLIALAIMSRTLIGGEDWNGFVVSTWALIFWIAMSLCV